MTIREKYPKLRNAAFVRELFVNSLCEGMAMDGKEISVELAYEIVDRQMAENADKYEWENGKKPAAISS